MQVLPKDSAVVGLMTLVLEATMLKQYVPMSLVQKPRCSTTGLALRVLFFIVSIWTIRAMTL